MKAAFNIRAIKYLLLFIASCWLALYLIFLLYRNGYEKYNVVELKKMNETLNGSRYHDVLFVGSSRTFYHVNPRIIDSITGLSSFNAGTDGAGLLEMNMILQSYLKTHEPPKQLILELSWQAFSIDGWGPIFNPNTYYPFLDNEIVYSTLKPYKPVLLLKYIPFFQLTQVDDIMREGAIAGHFGKKKTSGLFFL